MVVPNYPTIFLFIPALEEGGGAAQRKESEQNYKAKLSQAGHEWQVFS
jgi:hypothetical protein